MTVVDAGVRASQTDSPKERGAIISGASAGLATAAALGIALAPVDAPAVVIGTVVVVTSAVVQKSVEAGLKNLGKRLEESIMKEPNDK